MNENVDYFKDQKSQLTEAVEKAILQGQIINSVMPSKAVDNLLTQLGIIKTLYTPYFKQFILSQCIEDGKIEPNEFYLSLGGDESWVKISVEFKKSEPPVNAKKKWYQF